jgi:hypothetical protein
LKETMQAACPHAAFLVFFNRLPALGLLGQRQAAQDF